MSRIESPDNRVLQEDLERAAALDLPIEALDGSRIFVTGATGLIGRAAAAAGAGSAVQRTP